MAYVQVPVPEEHVPAVYDLLNRLQKGEAPRVDGEPVGPPPKATAGLIERVYDESKEPHRRLLDFLAARPGEWIETSELIDGLKLTNRKSVAGLLGSYGRRASFRYGGFRPWDQEWDRSRGEARYRMDGQVAEWVNQAAAEAD